VTVKANSPADEAALKEVGKLYSQEMVELIRNRTKWRGSAQLRRHDHERL
jgi:hypothetical protein